MTLIETDRHINYLYYKFHGLQTSNGDKNKLDCRRETMRCFVLLSLKVIQNNTLE